MQSDAVYAAGLKQEMPLRRMQAWHGDLLFLLQTMIEKDFKVRYRNMSLGVFWSLLNPLVMMTVLTVVWTKIMQNNTPHFAAFLLCGLVPFNFFTLGWLASTTSLVDNAGMIKRLTAPRVIIPISVILGNCVHFAIQIVLLLCVAVISGSMPNVYWLWLPLVLFFEVVFICGLGLMFSVLNVYIRDTRYFVESCNLILFWLVPIVYSFAVIPDRYKWLYHINPLAAVVFVMRRILIENVAPGSALINLALISTLILGLGIFVFDRMSKRLYDYL
jgi:ABC-type polysaccharide/polyol phosphate export permease